MTTLGDRLAAARNQSPRETLTGVPEGMQPDTLESLVGRRAEIEARHADKSGAEKTEAVKTDLETELDYELERSGFVYDEDDEASKEEYELAREAYAEAMNASPADWVGLDEGQTVTKKAKWAKKAQNHYIVSAETQTSAENMRGNRERLGSETSMTETNDGTKAGEAVTNAAQAPKTNALNEKFKHLSAGTALEDDVYNEVVDVELIELMDEYAKRVSDRSRSVVEGSKTGEGIEKAGVDLSDILAGIATELYADMEAAGMPHDKIVKEIDRFISDSTELTLQKIESNRLAEYNKSRPYVRKMYDAWAHWSEDKGMFSKGRLKKGAVLAAGGAVVAAPAALLVGAVGAGVITGAVVGLGARNISKNLAQGFMRNRDKKFAEAQTDEMRKDLAEIYAANTEQVRAGAEAEQSDKAVPRPESRNLDLIEFVNDRSHEYRIRNRNRVIGGVAIGMSVGLLSGAAADAMTDHIDNMSFGWVGDRIGELNLKNPFARNYEANLPEIPGLTIDLPELHDLDRDGTINRLDSDIDGDGVKNAADPAPRNADITGRGGGNGTPNGSETLHAELNEFSQAARIVERGEGWYQTFDEMGIPERHWADVLESAGPKLQDQDWAYFDESAEEWRISKPGKLPPEVLETIVTAAKRDGFDVSA
jgi:hypothetical protein